MIIRRKTREVPCGKIAFGGHNPVWVQSMCSTHTENLPATLAEIGRMEAAKCELIRVTVRDPAGLAAVPAIQAAIKVPLICDIHFDQRMALGCIDLKVDKVRINPGNLGNEKTRNRLFKEVVDAAKNKGVCMRIGVNSGSLEKDLLEKYGYPCPEALVDSALRWIEMAEGWGYHDMVISCKSSDVQMMVESYTLLGQKCEYPLHLGVTEAGAPPYAVIKSTAGLAPLLLKGIGDTIRCSLLAPPEDEVPVCYEILQATGRRVLKPEIIACPTCGRIEIDLVKAVKEIEVALEKRGIKKPVKISVLGCVVNGPGEAREADVGIAAGRGQGILFRGGEPIRKVQESEFVSALMEEVEKFIAERDAREAAGEPALTADTAR
ncbi:MAG TPA: flavodoxin-dependent (E)-4-hydroxy-3-methylbut-2-enyl-diphosphate synthase [Planctomycetota bacterium]|nr:flavodoxin-dependent (E)-4-hydroxy-3-methylbut-2-enyl-diphosphate synthase [Planctomycetota bacterium]